MFDDANQLRALLSDHAYSKDFGSIQTNEGATACWDAIKKAVEELTKFKK